MHMCKVLSGDGRDLLWLLSGKITPLQAEASEEGGMGLIYFYWTSPSQQQAIFSDLAEGVLNILSLSLL